MLLCQCIIEIIETYTLFSSNLNITPTTHAFYMNTSSFTFLFTQLFHVINVVIITNGFACGAMATSLTMTHRRSR